ncbi:MAG TPA: DUF4388 domain-containing protein [Anaeromyxobacter sp.]|nr:DUF4388 domain-containing protein [Anaeromyxobacter sp.]
MRGLMGSFAVLPLGDLVELLARLEKTGTLSCERGTVRKTVSLKGGAAIAAASNDPREYLGQLLINYGNLTEEQLTKAFQVQEETKIRLGKVLTMVGLVASDVIREVLAIKIRETLLDVFLWDSGVFTFDDGHVEGVDELDARVPLGEIAREAEFRATAWSAFRGEFPSGAVALAVVEDKVPAELSPTTVDGRLLSLAREGKTIDEIGLILHVTDFHLYQRLYSLARQGWLRGATSPPPAPPAGEDAAPLQLLDRARGLLADGNADEAELAAARAVELAPGLEPARVLLGEIERSLADRLRTELLETPRVPRLRVAAGELARLRLPSADRYLLSRCDGRRSVRDLARLAPLRELDVLKAVRRFADSGLVGY